MAAENPISFLLLLYFVTGFLSDTVPAHPARIAVSQIRFLPAYPCSYGCSSAVCLCLILCGGDRNYLDIHVCLFKYLPCKNHTSCTVPRLWHGSGRTCRSQSYPPEGGRDRRCRWGTDLVGYHGEFVVGLSQIQHGLYEVLAVYAKHPGDAHGKVFGEILLDRQLTPRTS